MAMAAQNTSERCVLCTSGLYLIQGYIHMIVVRDVFLGDYILIRDSADTRSVIAMGFSHV
jgi:hypothetical protein